MRNLLFCFLAFFFYIAAASANTEIYSPKITNQRTWQMLAAKPTSMIFQQSETVKFIIDFQEHNRIYFYNTVKYPFHIDFVHHYIAPDYDHATFNKIEYHSPNRRFAMGSLTHYRDVGIYALELSATDRMTAHMLTQVYRALQVKTYFNIHFRPQSPHQEEISNSLPDDIAVTPVSQFQHLQKYHALTLGKSIGELIFIDQDFDITQLKPHHIVISDHVPNDLPMVAGLITTKPQAPLSHVAILMSQRQKPNMMLQKNHPKITEWYNWKGQYVTLDVTAQDFTLTPTDKPDETSNTQKPVINIAFTPNITILKSLCDIRKSDIGAYGGKASYLGETCQIHPKLPIPNGFVIPTHFYQEHIKTHNIDHKTKEIDPKTPEKQLKEIRKAILTSKIDDKLIENVKSSLKDSQFANKIAFFRSSANIEDIHGFSGAGLYQSEKLKNLQNDEDIAKVIKEIWASLWSYRAYQERQNFKIDPNKIAMAILVQPFISDLYATGVAITGNPYTAYRPGYLINAQIVGDNVTANLSNTLPESFIIYHYDKDLPLRIISRSDLNQHQEIMNSNMRASLATYLGQIQKYFIPNPPKNNRQFMDVEFLIDRSGNIIIVQARPYQIEHREQKKTN